MELKLGRNDPCHCGSGRKYKKCHLPQDEQRLAQEREAKRKEEQSQEPPLKPDEIATLMEQLAPVLPDSERAGFERLSAQLGPLLEYQERQPQIEAASETLEKYREEFLQFQKDQNAYLARVQQLFAEPRYASLRFTADEVRTALVKAGLDYRMGFNKASAPMLRKAIVSVANKERRIHMAMHLALSLPDLVNAERYMDGWIVQSSAHMTAELQKEANPFLFEMFSHGYDAILQQRDASDDAILSELGVDRDRLMKMSPAEIDALCDTFRNDPVKSARIESVIAGRFTQEDAQAVAGRLEQEVLKWLATDEAKPLLLAPSEVEPYANVLAEKWDERVKSTGTGKPTKRDFQQTFWPAVRQMAQGVFTPERKQQFVIKAKDYVSQLFSQGKKEIAASLSATLDPLDSVEPESNLFLLSLCYFSLHAYLNRLPEP